ncbi:amino acid adenylation domain-containing protein [Micromonospora echinospora]|uniref:Amino acid adenylation domain-containing protein n=1 Tax=Micromonospora echinospora TaxID=1877 RepID=A0ABR6MDP6_MICEC|nr:non-ribosomal peptide synthetase/MFS transporter [Micromonospora echinospora]MBB5113500.1 amino acid adenylation domain-containing protein [Micromonospora echinospora]
MTESRQDVTPVEDVYTVPASYAQERVWFTAQLSPGQPLFTMTDAVTLPPGAGPEQALAALRAVTDRHESMRTTLRLDDGRLYQDIHPTVPVELPVTDLSGLPEPERNDARARIVAEYAGLDLPMDTAPLWRARLLRLGPDTWWLLFAGHHVVLDGTSLLILRAELTELCAAAVAGREPDLPDLPIQYADYAAWDRDRLDGPRWDELREYWREALTGLPAVHALTTDRPRPPTLSFDGADVRRTLPADVTRALPELAQQSAATPFMVQLAAYVALLHRLSGSDDVVVGMPVTGRDRAELEPLLGMFMNMLVLRVDVSGDPPFLTLVRRVRRVVLDAWDHQDMPFQRLVEELAVRRDPGVPPLYQLTFHHLPTGRGEAFGGAMDDLSLEIAGDELRLEYRTALFERAGMEAFADRYLLLFAAAVAAPRTRVSALPVMSDAERAKVVTGWNATDGPVRRTTLAELFDDQVRRAPDAVALVDGDTLMTYAELSAAAEQVARRLVAYGVGPESVVAIHEPRSSRLVAGLLGIHRAGAAYLPLDPDHPAQRLAFMLADAGAGVLLADEMPDGLTAPGAVLPLTAPDQPRTGERVAAGPGNAAYVIYTSGSTGRPKGVVNEHAAIVNRLDWMQDAFALGPDDAVLHKTPIGFDVSVWEVFWPLIVGARLVLAAPGGHRDPAYLRELIERERITTVHFVPSMLDAFLSTADPAGPARCGSLRRIVCSGEELPPDLARRAVTAFPSAALHNLYGPTEAAIDVTAWAATPAALAGVTRVPIGGPIRNVRTYVLDEAMRPAPVGVAGQLHLGGVQVARGYLNRPALTACAFVPDPFGAPGGRLYATGDLARWHADGTLEFLGRMDDQVKLRGLRIEPGEIAAVLREQPGVGSAAVVVRGATPAEQRLVAYLTGEAPDPAALRAALKRRLPEYMVPSAFVRLDALPLSANGKLDTAALPAPVSGGTAVERRTPVTPVEQAVAAAWRDVLGVTDVGLDDDFFELGGHSLLAIRMLAMLRAVYGQVDVGVMDVFAHPTVEGLAALIDGPADRERPLLYELTRPVPPGQRVRSYVCVPYGGGLASIYQPLADALPPGHTLFSVAVPGHDVGVDDTELPFDELVERCVAEIQERVDGPLVLYGHCVGGALLTGIARRLHERGRPIEAIYAGGVFPTARPDNMLGRLVDWADSRGADRRYETFLRSIGAELADLDQAQVDRFVHHVRREAAEAQERFTGWLDAEPVRVPTPVISVVGTHDVLTEYYEERYREWSFLGESTALVVLDQAGHYFVKQRAAALAEVLTRTHPRLAEPAAPRRLAGDGWELAATSTDPVAAEAAVQPGVRRFLALTASQLISSTGSALTQWAVPVWVYLETGSMLWFGLSGVIAYLPALLTLPVAGAVADRFDRRRVLLAACAVAVTAEALLAVLLWTDRMGLAAVYTLVCVLGAASVFQRITYLAAIPQVVPKRYLGHANGIAQLAVGLSSLAVPLLAAGLLAAIGLAGVLVIDIVSYVAAIGVLVAVRFPDLLGRRRKEPFLAELVGGARMAWAEPGFRAMLGFFSLYNLCLASLLLVPPMVLAFGTMGQVGTVAFAEALGAVLGGLAIAIWGGPTRRRMPALIAIAFGVAISLVLSGVRPSLLLVALGSFGVGLGLGLHNGIYLSIIQVKVPQRFHGRVLAIIQTLTWATLPLGFAVLVPLSGSLLEPMFAPGGALADSVGALIGTGPGRGLGFAFVVSGLALVVVSLGAYGVRRLRLFDTETPDAPADATEWLPHLRRHRVDDL